MKTKNVVKLAAILIAVVGISITGCKKDDTTNEQNAPDASSLSQQSQDENSVQSASDDALNDVENVLARGESKTGELPCNATLDSVTMIGSDTVQYNITYNGNNCDNTRHRTGIVRILKLKGQKWSETGAFVIVKLIDFKVTKLSNGKYVIINGTKTFVNVNGGLVKDLGNGTLTVVHRVTGSMQVAFANSTAISWNIARQISISGVPGDLAVSLEGFGSADGYDNLVIWGKNRKGEDCYSQITAAVVHKQSCGWDPVAGVRILSIPSADKSATLTFGFDVNNLPVAGGDCPERFRIDWTVGDKSGTAFLEI